VAIDPRDHRLDLLEAWTVASEKRMDEFAVLLERLARAVDRVESRQIIRRDLTPLERQLLDAEMERQLAGDVVRHYRRESDRTRRARSGLLAAIVAAAAAVGGVLSRLLPRGFHF
jgi:ATP/maltotriose-dependent transcriptional regulator MalT